MSKKVFWAFIVLLLIAYGLVVHNWWVEGSKNFQRMEQQ